MLVWHQNLSLNFSATEVQTCFSFTSGRLSHWWKYILTSKSNCENNLPLHSNTICFYIQPQGTHPNPFVAIHCTMRLSVALRIWNIWKCKGLVFVGVGVALSSTQIKSICSIYHMLDMFKRYSISVYTSLHSVHAKTNSITTINRKRWSCVGVAFCWGWPISFSSNASLKDKH